MFVVRDSSFPSERVRYSFITDYSKWDKYTQGRMYKYLYKCFKYMNASRRYIASHPGNPLNAATVLPEQYALRIIEKLTVTTHLKIAWGRKIFQSFHVWKMREREQRAAIAAAAALLSSDDEDTAAEAEVPVRSAANLLRQKRRHASNAAVEDTRDTASSPHKRARAIAAARAVHHPAYNALTSRFDCTECTRTFPSAQALGAHSSVHSAVVNSPGFYSCDMCNYLVQGSHDHQTHQQSCNQPKSTALGETCEFCRKTERSFILPINQTMNTHCTAIGHNHPKADTTVCDKCNKYIETATRHRCRGQSLDTTSMWVCVPCQLLPKRTHLFETNQKYAQHQTRYHIN